MLNTVFALFPPTSDEAATLKVLETSGSVMLMPTHHISHQGEMMGFRYDCSDKLGDILPISRNMFSGHTSSECEMQECDIMKLMSDSNQQKMKEFTDDIRANYNPPTLDCIPDNSEGVTFGIKSMDCRQWTPEMPESIGLYHAYIRGFNRDARVHKLFIICTGGCPKAADEFCNMTIDVGNNCTCVEMAESEEAWWLRRTCQRARCRLIKMLADKFGVKVQNVDDVLAYGSNGEVLAVPTTDTLEHDISIRDSVVSVYNLCTDTTRVTNGILCQMQPSEGYWLFRGAPRGAGVNGAMFGSQRVCGAFPSRSPLLPNKKYICFDEAFFKNLETMQWNRDNGFVEMIPIVVGTL
jgi:hypothetical protein